MARYYNPDMGVFLSLDPVRRDTLNPITMNGYNYANNNPVMNVDPDGELAWLWWMAKGALKGGLIALFTYKIEVKFGIQKASKSNAISQVVIAALQGAVLGGLGITSSKIKKLRGLLLIAKQKNTLQKGIKNSKCFYFLSI